MRLVRGEWQRVEMRLKCDRLSPDSIIYTNHLPGRVRIYGPSVAGMRKAVRRSVVAGGPSERPRGPAPRRCGVTHGFRPSLAFLSYLYSLPTMEMD